MESNLKKILVNNMKKEIQEIMDNIQYDDFYQKNFESSKGYEILVNELNYAESCHNLEDKLDFPLEVAFRALTDGIYIEDITLNTFEKYDVRGIELKGLGVISNICSYGDCDFTCYYKDYKKTWWLKKDKSE